MTDEEKKRMDSMSYREMFRIWRFSPVGNSLLQGESGRYFEKVMTSKRADVGPAEHTRISKELGWRQ